MSPSSVMTLACDGVSASTMRARPKSRILTCGRRRDPEAVECEWAPEALEERLRGRDDEEVRGLQVAMDDAALVRVADRPADRLEEAQAVVQLLVRRVLAAHVLAHVVPERLAGDQLHREEVLAVRGAPGFVERGDVGVDQPGQRLGLAAEQAQPQLVQACAADHDLEGDAPLRVMLLRLVDDPHAAAAQDREDPELADRLRKRDVRRGVGRDRETRRWGSGFRRARSFVLPWIWRREDPTRLWRKSLAALGRASMRRPSASRTPG